MEFEKISEVIKLKCEYVLVSKYLQRNRLTSVRTGFQVGYLRPCLEQLLPHEKRLSFDTTKVKGVYFLANFLTLQKLYIPIKIPLQ